MIERSVRAAQFQLNQITQEMEPHNRLSNQQFELQFKHGILHQSVFTHEAHLRLAYIHIAKYGLIKALEHAVEQISNYVKTVGQKKKYDNVTTTTAVKTVHHYMQKSKSDNFFDFIREFPELKHNFKELLGFYHAIDTFFPSHTTVY